MSGKSLAPRSQSTSHQRDGEDVSGNPAPVAEEVAVEAEATPLEQLLEALDEPDADGPYMLSWVAWLMNYDPAAGPKLLGDAAAMGKLAGHFDSEQMVQAMRFVDAPLPEAVRHVRAAGGMSATNWGYLVAGATGEECLAAVLDDATFRAVALSLQASAVEAYPALALDPGLFAQAIQGQPLMLPWLLTVDGPLRVAEILDRLAEYAVDQALREGLLATGMYELNLMTFVQPTLEGRSARRLYNWLLMTDDLDEAMKLFHKRFDVELLNQGAVQDDPSTEEDETVLQVDWDITSIIRVWQICATLPPEQAATAATILREGDSGGAGGWADYQQNIGMSWGTDQMGSTEVGAFTEDGDAMRGLNIFDATMRHEIGHTVGATQGFDTSGGFVWTTFGWKEEEQRSLMRQVFAAKYSLGSGLSADEREFAIRGLARAASFDEEGLKTSINAVGDNNNVADLWDKVAESDLVDFVMGRSVEECWNTPIDIDGRSYHMDYPPNGTWVSCPMDRYSNKVSNYAMRSPAEWFAEVYATFYADADRPNVAVGTTLLGRDARAYQYMLTKVHTLWNLFSMTGQDLAHDSMGV